MMNNPESVPDEQESDFEWVRENGRLVKVTQQNSNGRKCSCCGCDCPCRCRCCKTMCCSCKVRAIR